MPRPLIQHPRLKRVFPVFSVGHSQLSLGMPGTPRTATIDDPDGTVRTLVALLDGTRSPEQISRAMQTVSANDVYRTIAMLAEAGYVEDAEQTPPSGMVDRELA